MLYYRLKRTFTVIIATLLAAFIFALVRVGNVSKLSAYAGERTYYLDSASSQSLQKAHLSGLEFLRVQGESVYIKGEGEAYAQKVMKEVNARVLWIEEVDGVRSHYCYTPLFGEGVVIGGQKVNLHIAVSSEGCAIGYPIIFGGY